MKKATMHYVLDGIEGTILLLMVVSGAILWFTLPEGSPVGKTVLLFDRPTWIEIHRWLGVGLLVFFSAHVLTHWTWLAYMTRSFFKKTRKS